MLTFNVKLYYVSYQGEIRTTQIVEWSKWAAQTRWNQIFIWLLIGTDLRIKQLKSGFKPINKKFISISFLKKKSIHVD